MEQLLHYVFKHKMFPLRELQTIDGKTVEDSKMKNAFIIFPGFVTGNHKLKNLTVFSLKQSAIAQSDDSGWERLQAWLNAYYMMQK